MASLASRIPQRVVLINGKRLTELMVEHGVGVRTSRIVEFKRLDEDFFSEEDGFVQSVPLVRSIHPAGTAGDMIKLRYLSGRPSSSRAGGHPGARPGDH